MSKFLNQSAEFVYYRTYSRWRDDLKRRENWDETVQRVLTFLKEERGEKVPKKVFNKIEQYMLNFDVLPSMRLVWAAGEAAKKDNTTMYNCSFISVDSIDAFSECLYILCCGTGVGYSVENKHIKKLPEIQPMTHNPVIEYIVPDSKAGWADSVKVLIKNLYKGQAVNFDYSQIRPKGSRLKTMGGRASGPEPLVILHNYIKEVFNNAQGRKLTSLECSDIMNEIAQIVVVAGVRRSSEICLSDLNDEEMRTAKIWPMPTRRYMANHSAIYYEKPDAVNFLKEWSNLASSGTGERGIFNFSSVIKKQPERTKNDTLLGTNPCGEILLRNLQFCNLSTVIVRPNDDLDTLLEKMECAAWIGTIQASFTKFPYLRKKWKQNCEEEALLGISLSGQMDNPKLLTPDVLKALKSRARKVNKKAAKLLEISESAAITCVKPEGTTSQVTVSGSGLHPWYSQHFIRRYRIADTDPLCKMLKDQGVKMTPENGQTVENVNTWVISFPVKAPKSATFRTDMSAIDQLEWYKKLQENWCEHNASCTIYVKDHEWFEVGNWVYQNWDSVIGVSFLPYDGGHYEQAPYEEITKEEYEKLLKDFPKIDYSELSKYETDDNTDGAKSYACVGDKCELK